MPEFQDNVVLGSRSWEQKGCMGLSTPRTTKLQLTASPGTEQLWQHRWMEKVLWHKKIPAHWETPYKVLSIHSSKQTWQHSAFWFSEWQLPIPRSILGSLYPSIFTMEGIFREIRQLNPLVECTEYQSDNWKARKWDELTLFTFEILMALRHGN